MRLAGRVSNLLKKEAIHEGEENEQSFMHATARKWDKPQKNTIVEN